MAAWRDGERTPTGAKPWRSSTPARRLLFPQLRNPIESRRPQCRLLIMASSMSGLLLRRKSNVS
jgi:hypothetical protein